MTYDKTKRTYILVRREYVVLPNLIILSFFMVCIGTRLAVTLRGDESYEQLDILKDVDDITMLLHNVPYGEEKTGRVHAARR